MKSCKERIKAVRASTGLSQVAFSKKFSIPLPTIEAWERGTREAPAYWLDVFEWAVEKGYMEQLEK